MRKVTFTKEQKLLHHLILHSHDVPGALGLFDGMTGIMLVLAHYARVRKMPVVESVSDYLMEHITKNLNKTGNVDFANGMAGIGWGIEYLIQNGYMSGCGTDLTGEMDERIMSVDIRRMSDANLEKGIRGLFHYVIAHMQGAILCGKAAFDRHYLTDWIETLQRKQANDPKQQEWRKMREQLESTLHGQQTYRFELSQFILPKQYAPMHHLGLRNGLAGYMELQLQNLEQKEHL